MICDKCKVPVHPEMTCDEAVRAFLWMNLEKVSVIDTLANRKKISRGRV